MPVLCLVFCKRLDPCLEKDSEEMTVRLGDTVLIRSCSVHAEMYEWLVDDEEPNLFLDHAQPFFNHYADSGGTACDNFIRLYFHDTGEHVITVHFAKLRRKAKCTDGLFPVEKAEARRAVVMVKDTVKPVATP